MRVGQPGVDRHARHLDGEADEQQQERPPLQRLAEQDRRDRTASVCLADLLQGQDVERVTAARVGLAMLGDRLARRRPRARRRRASATSCSVVELAQIAVEVQHQDGDQHQHAAEQRVEEELDRRVFAPRAAPDADQEVHRQQHHFPEDVEQEEVERQEDAEHARFEQQEQNAVGLHVLVDRPAGAHRQHADERR